jgi:hypothetical protein
MALVSAGGVVHDRRGDPFKVHEHLLHPGEVLGPDVGIPASVEKLRGMELVRAAAEASRRRAAVAAAGHAEVAAIRDGSGVETG